MAYFVWVSTFDGVISEARGYPTEEELWAGLPLFVSEYLGGYPLQFGMVHGDDGRLPAR